MNIIPEQFTEDAHIKTWPLSSLVKKMKEKLLNVEPSYQRGNVWESAEKTKLIQSILGGIQLPALIFSKSGNKLIAIDGKQRLTAMKEFIDNKIKFYNESDADNFCYYKDLDKEWKSRYEDTQISVYQYTNLKEEEQREIFERINYGKILSYGEKIKGLNSELIPEITEIVDNIKRYLTNFGINNKRCSYYECVGALLALFNKSFVNVSKGKSCLEYVKKLSKNVDVISIAKLGKSIKIVLEKLNKIYINFVSYCKTRKYKKLKWKWTDVLLYIYMLHEEYDSKTIKKVSRYIKHRQEESIFLTDNSLQYISYNDKFSQRSNTNSSNFFKDRVKLIIDLHKWIIKKPNNDIRNQVYAKCGTSRESMCKFCNIHKIYATNFQLGHIISKNNGGSMEVSNLYPICATCNNSMNTQDMDYYIKQHKLIINLL